MEEIEGTTKGATIKEEEAGGGGQKARLPEMEEELTTWGES